MLTCAVAPSTWLLATGRLLTGAGVGAIVPCISALAAEYANRRNRERAVIVVAIGFPAGGLLGGTLASVLLSHFDWRSVFVAGTLTTAMLAVVALYYLPESLEFLVAGRPVNGLARVNAILRRLQRPPLLTLPAAITSKTGTSLLDIVLNPALLSVALLITLVYAMHNATTYYALNWIPKSVADLSLSQSQAASVGAWCSGGGIVGSVLAAWLSTRFDIRPVTVAYLLGAALFLWIFARVPADMGLLISASGALGACLYGAQVSLYALMTRSFPVHVRATGVGFVTGAGRVGGIVAPIISGELLGMGLGYSRVSSLMALGSLVGAVALFISASRPPARTLAT
jgi:MFS family permease